MTIPRKRWLYLGGTLLVLVLMGPWIFRTIAARILEGAEFRQFITGTASGALTAKVTYEPFHFRESKLESAGMEGLGMENGWFSRLEVRDLSAKVSLWRLIFGKRELDGLDIGAINLQLDGPRLGGRMPPAPPSGEPMHLGVTKVGRARLGWSGGSLSGVALQSDLVGEVWHFSGQGGRLEEVGAPPLDVRAFELRQHGGVLAIQSADFGLGFSGQVKLEGEVRWEKEVNLDLNFEFAKIPLESLPLSPQWREALAGLVNGKVKVAGPIINGQVPEISGTLNLSEGRIAAQPFVSALPFIAVVPEIAKPDKVALSRAEGQFRKTGDRLVVTQLVLESAGLVKLARLDGEFVVENGQIKGNFQVGVPPIFNRLAPRIFTALAGGYAWAPMHVEGPLDHPRNDLTARVEEALKAAGVGLLSPLDSLSNPVDAARGAAQGAADLLQGTIPGADALKKGLDLFSK